MKPNITKEEFIEKLRPELKTSLRDRLGIDLESDITIEEIQAIIQQDTDKLSAQLKKDLNQFGNNDEDT